MAQIVLVQPIANRFDKVATRVPNGLLAISALPAEAGYTIKIIDRRVDDRWLEALKKSIDSDTICVGITCSTGKMIANAIEIAGAVRKINQNVPIVWGGPHPTLVPKQTLESSLVDIIVINEGDVIFMELVKALAGKRDLSEVKGIGYKMDGELKINPPATLIEDLNALPQIPYSLIDLSRYSAFDVDGHPSIDILTSRGCPHNCGFCSTPVTSMRRWRALSVDMIIKNIHFLKDKHGIRTFYLIDDNFMVDLKRVEKFVDALKENELKIYWGTQGVRVETVNKISSDLLDKIEESGCVELSIGIESANPEVLNMIDKKFNMQDVIAANEKLKKRRFSVKFNMIIGFPGETIDGISRTVRLAVDLYKQNSKAWFPFNIFTPFPGTPMFQKAIEGGFTPPHSLDEWVRLESTGWGRYYGHWMNEAENRLLESINCTAYLAFPAAIKKISNKFIKALMYLYRPVAYMRFRHTFYFAHIEKFILQRIDSL